MQNYRTLAYNTGLTHFLPACTVEPTSSWLFHLICHPLMYEIQISQRWRRQWPWLLAVSRFQPMFQLIDLKNTYFYNIQNTAFCIKVASLRFSWFIEFLDAMLVSVRLPGDFTPEMSSCSECDPKPATRLLMFAGWSHLDSLIWATAVCTKASNRYSNYRS